VEAPKGLNLEEQLVYHYDPFQDYEFTLSFPEVVRYKPHTEYSINNHIQQITSVALDEFQARVANISDQQGGAREIGINKMELSYTVNFNDDGLLSIVFDKYVNIADEPEPYLIHLAFNYHYHDDKPLELSDIFSDKNGAKRYLNSKVKSLYPKAKYATRHLSNFAIVPNGIKIYFNIDLEGVKNVPETFVVTWSELDQFLNEGYRVK
jgi:hypothetical protein